MKTLYNIYEGLLSDIDSTLNNSDDYIDSMHHLNWRLTHYDTKNFRAVSGGRKGVVEKYFGKNLEKISASTHIPYSKDYELAKKNTRAYDTPAMWLEAIILNTKYDAPIDDTLKRTVVSPYKIIDDKLEYEFNSRLLPEYKAIYENGNPIIRTATRWIHRPQRTEVIIRVYLTSAVLKADMDNNYGILCEITFLYYGEHK